MTLIRNTSNFIFKNILIFFIMIAWTNFYIHNLLLSFTTAVILTVLISIAVSSLITRKETNRKLSRQKITARENLMLNLTLTSLPENLNMFKDFLQQNRAVVKADSFLILDNQAILFCEFLRRELTEEDVCAMLRYQRALKLSRIIICTNEISANARILLSRLGEIEVDIYDKNNLFSFFEQNSWTPPDALLTSPLSPNKKLAFRQLLYFVFNKSRAKSFFFLGLIMIFSSFITLYSLYYTIFASLMFGAALFCLVNKPFNTPVSNNTLSQN